MKSYRVNMGAGFDGLRRVEEADPVPGPREVLIRVRASALNNRELSIIVHGRYPLPVKPDLVPLCDGAGEVVAVGDGVTRVRPGDRVASVPFPRWIDGPFALERSEQLGGALDGMLREFAVVSEEAVVHVPGHLSFEEAAALPCAGVTAWNALTGGRPLQAGDTVLTLGSGGVSLFAIQLARLFGAQVIATTSSDAKADRLRTLGAREVVNYEATPGWDAAVRQLSGGRGVDLVVEVGGDATLERSWKSTAVAGQVSWVGRLAGAGVGPLDLNLLWAGGVTLRPIAIGSRAHFQAMNRAIALHGLRPVIDRMFHFDEAPAAFRYYATGKAFGKVVIRHP